jgi:hypothetical protein
VIRAVRWVGPTIAASAALGALLLGCAGGADGSGSDAGIDGGRSSTIAWSGDGEHLWVTSPDDDQVVAVDADSLEVVGSVDVSGQPQQLAVVGGRVVVTGAQRTSLAVVTDAPTSPSAATIAEVPVPCGAPRSVVGLPGDRHVAITCPVDDRVVVVDLDGGVVVATAELDGRPTGMAHDGDRLLVTTAVPGEVVAWPLDDVLRAATAGAAADGGGPGEPAVQGALPPPAVVQAAWADGERSPSLLGAIDVGAMGPVGVYQVVDNDRRLSSRELAGDPSYGNPLDGRARLEPAIAAECGARFADFADGPRALALPVAIAADPVEDLVWVVGQSSRSVSVVRCQAGGPSGRSATVASFDVGDGPRGIVLAPDGRTAFVDAGFDHEVARLELPAGWDPGEGDGPIERVGPAAVGRRPVVDRYLSPLAQTGRRMFHDATDRHLTPFGVVSCASCHPAAGDDGLTWRIETDANERKVRRTPPVWEVDAAAKPLHWDGEFDDADALSLMAIRDLLGGDGLLVDTAAISAYLAEALAPPGSPARLDGRGGELVAAGEVLFEGDAFSCATCHAGPSGSDGRRHDVLARVAERSAQLDLAVTPTLTGTRGRAPYGHDGRAPTLAALLGEHRGVDGQPLGLSSDELAAVEAYLATR